MVDVSGHTSPKRRLSILGHRITLVQDHKFELVAAEAQDYLSSILTGSLDCTVLYNVQSITGGSSLRLKILPVHKQKLT